MNDSQTTRKISAGRKLKASRLDRYIRHSKSVRSEAATERKVVGNRRPALGELRATFLGSLTRPTSFFGTLTYSVSQGILLFLVLLSGLRNFVRERRHTILGHTLVYTVNVFQKGKNSQSSKRRRQLFFSVLEIPRSLLSTIQA